MDDNSHMKKLIFLLLALMATHTSAASLQSHAAIRDAVQAFVLEQTRALPGKTSIQVGQIDPRTQLPACAKLEAFLPPGTHLSGNTNIGVRCNGKQPWSIFVQVSLKTTVNILVLKNSVLANQTLAAHDIGTLPGESLPAGVLTDPAQAIGKVMKYGVSAGQILRQDMIRAPYTVKTGQTVQLRVKGSGYSVSSEGQALGNAAEGESTTARTASGQIVSGVARGGALEIIQ